MNANDKKELKDMFTALVDSLRSDIEKESTKDMRLETSKRSNDLGLEPEYFTGNTEEDATQWLDFYERIALINNWTPELQLQAFPLYLKGVAGTWFLTLGDTIKGDLPALKAAFNERFAFGPHSWILSQQLGTRKMRSDESLDDYANDITRSCKRLGLSDTNSMRYFIEGLQSDLQAYVTLQQPKTLQEAESFARMKHTINKRQGLSDNHSDLTQITSLLTRLSDKLTDNASPKSVAAFTSPPHTAKDVQLEILSQQIKQLQQQQELIECMEAETAYSQF